MNEQDVLAMKSKMVDFVYDGDHTLVRQVMVEAFKTTADGKIMIVGRDYTREKQYRSFYTDKMTCVHVW